MFVWIIIGLVLYFGIGVFFLMKGSSNHGSPDGTTVFWMIVAWPIYFREAFGP
jgi:hypothetical protein